jgi:hypothetical protein
MFVYKGLIASKGLVSKIIPPKFMVPSKLFWQTSLWGLKRGGGGGYC